MHRCAGGLWLQGHTACASLLCSVGKIFHCVHYLSAAPRVFDPEIEKKNAMNTLQGIFVSNFMQHSPFRKPIGSQLVKKLLAIFWHLKVSMCTRAQHLNLSSAKLRQSMRPKPVSLTSVLMLLFHLHINLRSSLFHSDFVMKPDMYFSSPHVCHMPHPFNLP